MTSTPPSNPLLRIFRSVLNELEKEVRRIYIDCLIKKQVPEERINQSSNTSFWTLDIEVDKSFRKAFDLIIKEVTGEIVNRKYFFHSNYESRFKGKNKAHLQIQPISIFLYFIGFKEGDFVTRFNDFLKDIEKHKRLPKSEIQTQREYLFEDLGKPFNQEKKISQLSGENKKQLIDRFKGSYWWFYFLGYPTEEEDRDINTNWRIVKLVLSFNAKKDNQQLTAHILNTKRTRASEHHFDYRGEVDIEHSTENVMVINLRTVERLSRQLNIKISIPSLDGSFFLGQYLNYDSNGRVFSGTLIIQQIISNRIPATEDKSDLAPVPCTYHLPEDLEELKKMDEIGHVVDFFKKKDMNFRKTTNKVFDISGFKQWQKEKEDLGKIH